MDLSRKINHEVQPVLEFRKVVRTIQSSGSGALRRSLYLVYLVYFWGFCPFQFFIVPLQKKNISESTCGKSKPVFTSRKLIQELKVPKLETLCVCEALEENTFLFVIVFIAFTESHESYISAYYPKNFGYICAN